MNTAKIDFVTYLTGSSAAGHDQIMFVGHDVSTGEVYDFMHTLSDTVCSSGPNKGVKYKDAMLEQLGIEAGENLSRFLGGYAKVAETNYTTEDGTEVNTWKLRRMFAA